MEEEKVLRQVGQRRPPEQGLLQILRQHVKILTSRNLIALLKLCMLSTNCFSPNNYIFHYPLFIYALPKKDLRQFR